MREGELLLKRRGLGERPRELGADFTSSSSVAKNAMAKDLFISLRPVLARFV